MEAFSSNSSTVRWSDPVVRPQISDALVWVGVWVCGLASVTIGLFGLLTDVDDLLRPALTTAAIATVGVVQKVLRRPHPLSLLVVASAGVGLMVPFAGEQGHVVLMSSLTVLGAVGALALPHRASMWYAVWCALLSVVALAWVIPETATIEVFLVGLVLTAVVLGSWRFVSIAADLLVREEQRSRDALEENRRLLEFEHALALCSRALLVGRGEDALQPALDRLRDAIDADVAYLAVNVDDAATGTSFDVVESAVRPGCEVDQSIGTTRSWSEYPEIADVLRQGHPFVHLPTGEAGEQLSRSILSVPIFMEGRWSATVGFVDFAARASWEDEAIRMLEVAAPMLGAFWERETTRKRLEELIKSKDQFVASVSHELRTPLAAVLGFAEELRTNATSFRSEELTGMLELIAAQSQEMADMVEDLLVSARAEIGTVSIHPQEVYLRAQVETVLAGLGGSQDKTVTVAGGRGRVWADPSRTRQIIRNLITNALRYGGDQITIRASEGLGQTHLEVADDGPGLDKDSWETIFEPYRRAHDAPTQPSSIGLGLTVSRQLARLMGGDLVYRADSSGSVLTLSLPLSPDDHDGRHPDEVVPVSVAGGT